LIPDTIQADHCSGVALEVMQGEAIHAKGHGSATNEKENTVDTVFHVASMKGATDNDLTTSQSC